MNTPARLFKGAGLTLSRLATAIAGQAATVPIYLSFWEPETYGFWLILQGMLGYLSLLSTAYQQYTYAEVLKSGPNQPDSVRHVYWASLSVAYMIALGEFAVTLGFAPQAISAAMPSAAAETAASVADLVILYSVLNLITMPFGAITSQTMTIHGYYPQSAAWGLLRTASSIVLPAVAVVFGAKIWTAGLMLVASHAAPALLSLLYWFRLGRRFGLLSRTKIDWRMGIRNAVQCVPLAARTFVDSFRQQGFRIILGGYAGSEAVTELSTTRTFTNVLQQGLSTITAPLMPELMRYVVNRDQERMEGAFAVVWLAIFVLLVPGALVLSLLAEPIFLVWTRGTVAFDARLFSVLLAAVLTYAAAQPAAAILQGQNRVAWIFSISILAGVCLGAFSIVVVPDHGLLGAGIALLGAEMCAGALTVAGATWSLRRSGLAFPRRSCTLVISNVGAVFGLVVFALTVFEAQPFFMALPFAVNVVFASLYWATIPEMVRSRIRGVLSIIRTKLRTHAD